MGLVAVVPTAQLCRVRGRQEENRVIRDLTHTPLAWGIQPRAAASPGQTPDRHASSASLPAPARAPEYQGLFEGCTTKRPASVSLPAPSFQLPAPEGHRSLLLPQGAPHPALSTLACTNTPA